MARSILTERCLIIAEAGTSHGGDLSRALQIVDAAAAAGADCVKFQAVFADEIIHPLTGTVELPGGAIPLYERFKALERDHSFYARLKSHTESKGMLFLCSAFGPRSVSLLHDVGVHAYKIASPELNHFPLLRLVASRALPVLLSTGVSTLADIEAAVNILGPQAVPLHCVTSYPAPEAEYNLRLIPHLHAIMGLPVGLSDHSVDPVLVPALAAALGACCVEKHFALSREGGGLDDPIAQEPDQFARTVHAVREAQANGVERTIARLSENYGRELVEAVLGDGVKRLAPSEAGNYATTRRSIHALVTVEQGRRYGPENVAILRSEKNLRPGISPEHWEWLLGRKASRTVPAGQGVTWSDV